MSSSLRRGVAAAFFAFSLATLTACGAGHGAETGKTRPDNASAQVDEIKVQNVNVVLPEGNEGPGGISARLFNDGAEDQTLEAVALPDAGQQAELIPAEGGGPIVVPARGSIALGGEGNVSAFLEDPAAGDVVLGNAQRVVFLLSETGEISLSARVVEDDEAFGHFADWGPSAPPEPEPSEDPADEGTDETDGTGLPGDDASGEDQESPDAPADGTTGEPGDGTDGTEDTEGTEGEPADGSTGEESGDGLQSEDGTVGDDGTVDDGTADDGVVGED
ncbi:hypothetical protein [Streptomyces sp. SBT349]|uniref:hypothetical protein n=1 Tax=Streptomyces sp. SBT349 TaxID=1580539 RepID=UPI0007C6B947|nr:hypothetical protein [Streptomyces sp. SBT349]